MNLIYLWIESYAVFTKTGFHFSNDYKFEYSSGTLKIKDSEGRALPNGFFENNCTNVSVVVGDNGAGKTSLLKCVMDCLALEEDNMLISFAAAFRDESSSEIYVYSQNLSDFKTDHTECKKAQVKPLDHKDFRELIRKTKLIYLSNVLDLQDYAYGKRGGVFDGSIGGLMRRDFQNNRENHHITLEENQIYNFFNNDIYRQVDFLIRNERHKPKMQLPFTIPNFLKVSIVKSNVNLKNTEGAMNIESFSRFITENQTEEVTLEHEKTRELLYMVHEYVGSLQMSDTEKWFDQMAEHILINGIKEVAQSYVRPAIRIDEWGCLFEAYEPYQEGVDSVLAYSSRFLNRAMKKLLDAGSIYFDRLKPYAEFIDWIISHKDAFDIEVDLIDSSVAFIKMHALEASHSQSKLFQTFFEHYIRTCRPYYYLNFSWELSTGESNLLSLFARMHAVLKPEVDGGRGTKLVNDFINGEVMCEQVLLLIDEADLSYHPRWQLKYVSALLDAVSSLYSYYKVQILLTTHSPLLLSDIPKSQVLYLRQGKVHLNTEHQETFGQNIYTLFNDAFFVDKTAGEFSDRMIRSVHSGLEELLVQMKSKEDGAQSVEGGMNERLDYLAYIISIIGEPVIRKAFDAKLQQIRAAYQSSKLKETIALYNDLSVEERNQLIDHIIKTNDGRQ